MQSKFESYLKDNFPYLLKERCIICCSAGVDSVVLFHLMLSVNKNILVAHCNFKLRGVESDKDEEFVMTLCKENSIKFYSKSFDTKKIKENSNNSIQMIARDLRYEFFDKISNELKINHILTAHHLNDSLESFIINISRGSGLDGLTGVPMLNGKIKRPLIDFEKKEIIDYAKNKNLRWREDSSNKLNSYLRNRVRNNIISELEDLEGNFLKNFKKTIKYLKMSNSLIHERINNIKADLLKSEIDEISLNIKSLNEINKEAFLYYFLRDYGFVDWSKIMDLLDGESGKKIYSKSHVLFKEKSKLILREIKLVKNFSLTINSLDTIKLPLENGASLSFKEVEEVEKDNFDIITVDKGSLVLPLKLRYFNHGDTFCPFGMNGTKKVGKFLKDNGVNELDRSSKLILVNGDNKIIWIVGMRLDKRFSVKKDSVKLLNIEYLK